RTWLRSGLSSYADSTGFTLARLGDDRLCHSLHPRSARTLDQHDITRLEQVLEPGHRRGNVRYPLRLTVPGTFECRAVCNRPSLVADSKQLTDVETDNQPPQRVVFCGRIRTQLGHMPEH